MLRPLEKKSPGETSDVKVECTASELVHFAAPTNQTCGEYMADFFSTAAEYIVDANSTDTRPFCQYSTGADYAKGFNLGQKYYAWRDVSNLSLSLHWDASLTLRA